MCKPISFKPSNIDAALINALAEKGSFKNNSDLIRRAIFSLAKSNLSQDEYYNIVVSGYEKDVEGSN